MEEVTCFCLKCKAELGTFKNSWNGIGSNYYSPVHPRTSAELGLKAKGKVNHAIQGSHVQDCSVQDLACKKCGTILGMRCENAPDGHMLTKGQVLLRLPHMSVISQKTREDANISVFKMFALTASSLKKSATSRRASTVQPTTSPNTSKVSSDSPVSNEFMLPPPSPAKSHKELDSFETWAKNMLMNQRKDIDRICETVNQIEQDMRSFRDFMVNIRKEIAISREQSLNREDIATVHEDLNGLWDDVTSYRQQQENFKREDMAGMRSDVNNLRKEVSVTICEARVSSKEIRALVDDVHAFRSQNHGLDDLKAELEELKKRIDSFECGKRDDIDPQSPPTARPKRRARDSGLDHGNVEGSAKRSSRRLKADLDGTAEQPTTGLWKYTGPRRFTSLLKLQKAFGIISDVTDFEQSIKEVEQHVNKTKLFDSALAKEYGKVQTRRLNGGTEKRASSEEKSVSLLSRKHSQNDDIDDREADARPMSKRRKHLARESNQKQSPTTVASDTLPKNSQPKFENESDEEEDHDELERDDVDWHNFLSKPALSELQASDRRTRKVSFSASSSQSIGCSQSSKDRPSNTPDHPSTNPSSARGRNRKVSLTSTSKDPMLPPFRFQTEYGRQSPDPLDLAQHDSLGVQQHQQGEFRSSEAWTTEEQQQQVISSDLGGDESIISTSEEQQHGILFAPPGKPNARIRRVIKRKKFHDDEPQTPSLPASTSVPTETESTIRVIIPTMASSVTPKEASAPPPPPPPPPPPSTNTTTTTIPPSSAAQPSAPASLPAIHQPVAPPLPPLSGPSPNSTPDSTVTNKSKPIPTTKIYPYKCTVCGKGYIYLKGFQKHKETPACRDQDKNTESRQGQGQGLVGLEKGGVKQHGKMDDGGTEEAEKKRKRELVERERLVKEVLEREGKGG